MRDSSMTENVGNSLGLCMNTVPWTADSNQCKASPAASCFPVRMGETGARTQLYLSEETSDDRQRGCFPHVGRSLFVRLCREKIKIDPFETGAAAAAFSISPESSRVHEERDKGDEGKEKQTIGNQNGDQKNRELRNPLDLITHKTAGRGGT
ncbi:unnamed protein product [Boreogadus saida]